MDGNNIHPCIQEYIELVRSSKYPVCKEQLQLMELVENALAEPGVYVDGEQLEKYLSYQKYFPFDLFPWEKFLFALHCCTYTADGFPRFSVLLIYVGRGSGKNGYLGFENFCELTPASGLKSYHIYDYANSENQAKRSWEDVHDVLEENKTKLSRFFYWNDEGIKNLKTGSEYHYMANNAKTGDSYRPGKVNHDEVHAAEDTSAITTAITGLGKKPQPRRTICTTNGDVRGGYLDELLERSRKILDGEIPDSGFLPFICHLESDDEIEKPEMWYKANPSLQYLPTLMWEIQQELIEYKINPVANSAFPTKRMNRPPHASECGVAPWELIQGTNQPIDEEKLKGRPCIAAADYMKTNDFLGAGLLYYVDGKYIWVSHTWVCSRSADLKRIKVPLRAWEKAGLLTFVDAEEIPPELPAVWLVNEAVKRGSKILKFAIDSYRWTWMRRAFEAVNITDDKKSGKVYLVRPSNEMLISPVITSGFTNGLFVWGDNPLMRWAANNTKLVTLPSGNITYGKIEPKSRKTDPFKAFVNAMCLSSELEKQEKTMANLKNLTLNINVY
ncbi:MAG: terminase large subunit [Oscillospiraceae bacterium]|nr:terminase large subunit [Oscillospiraceae bacterium]